MVEAERRVRTVQYAPGVLGPEPGFGVWVHEHGRMHRECARIEGMFDDPEYLGQWSLQWAVCVGLGLMESA